MTDPSGRRGGDPAVEVVFRDDGESVASVVGAYEESVPSTVEHTLIERVHLTGTWLRDRHRGPVPAHAEHTVDPAPVPERALDKLAPPHRASLRLWDDHLRSGRHLCHGPLSLDRIRVGDAAATVRVVTPEDTVTADPALDVGTFIGHCVVLSQEAPRAVGTLSRRLTEAFRAGYDGTLRDAPIDDLAVRRASAVGMAHHLGLAEDGSRVADLVHGMVEACWRMSA